MQINTKYIVKAVHVILQDLPMYITLFYLYILEYMGASQILPYNYEF